MGVWGHAFHDLRSRAREDTRLMCDYILSRSFGFCEGCGKPRALSVQQVAAGSSPSSYAALCPVCPSKRGLEEKTTWLERHLEDRSLLYVTAAVVREANAVLMCQKRSGLWEFPGGKMDDGETLSECLTREIREELDIQVAVLKPLCMVDHDYGSVQLRLFALECEWLSGAVVLRDHLTYRWEDVAELKEELFSAADRVIVSEIKR